MRKIILLGMVLLPCMAFADSDCRVVEFADHYEAICVGSAEQTPASSQTARQEQTPATSQTANQEQAVESAQTVQSELPDVPPEQIVRNELARQHGVTWLAARAGR
jgi:hypothetical protein